MNEQQAITGYEFVDVDGMFQRLRTLETPEESAEASKTMQEETLENIHQYMEAWFYKAVRDAVQDVVEVDFNVS